LAEIEAQFGSEASTSVDAINRREDEVWSDHLGRVAANPVAKAVKISDLIDNSNLG
jgi:hypothetical protein